MQKKRIVVTGMGIVSCLGHDVELFYEKLLRGESGVRTITKFNCDNFSTRIAATVCDFDVGEYLEKKQARRVDTFIAYAAVAGKKALEMAKLYPNHAAANPERSGVIIGTGMGGMGIFFDGAKTLLEKGPSRITPFFVPYIISNMAGALLAIDLDFRGPNYPIATACATSHYAIIAAAEHIRRGEADIMVTGGVEAPILPIGLGGFTACRALSLRNDSPEKASRPWDRGRDGFVMGEGAGVLVLESLESATRRGAPIFAEYLGGATSCDAWHITEPRPDGEGILLCLKKAFADAECSADDINYINAHATSTPIGDMVEVEALRKIFAHPERVLMNATKSMIGHSLGAAGAMGAIATIMACRSGRIHPTINLDDPEPIPFSLPRVAEKLAVRTAICNAFGFGGHNATLVFRPWNE
jgi:3-oxoacyl-[acyl-carrier-protein] synthase II